MSFKKQIALTLALVMAFGAFTVGIIGMAKREKPMVTIELDLPAAAVSEQPRYVGNVYEPEFRWVAPVAEPAGI